MDLKTFQSKFAFKPEGAFLVGVERECFLADLSGRIVPHAPQVIAHAKCSGIPIESIGYELSACQIETRTVPALVDRLPFEVEWPERELNRTLRDLDLQALHVAVAPADMPLDVYPDPTGRYAEITRDMPHEVLLAACRVAGTHVHIGMPDHETALQVYNGVLKHARELCAYGGGLEGERLQIYRVVAPDREPKPYEDWPAFLRAAEEKGFAENPRNCWTLIRISVHGTLEFRMFSATPSRDSVVEWGSLCHRLCLEAL